MVAIFVAAVVPQAIAMLVDELWFHRRRGLGRWERIGHPLDTLTIVACLAWLLIASPSDPIALPIYVGLAISSTLFVTKDESIHARECGGGEQWLHAVLFALHPIVLAAFGLVWWSGHDALLAGQLVVTLGFLGYQVLYWNVLRRPVEQVNNAWYADLGARWYTAADTPIALLRAESRHRNPWIAEQIEQRHGRGARVLDLGCGGGFLSNYLAERGHRVAGIDTTPENLAIATRHDRSGRVAYVVGDACALPFADASFDVVMSNGVVNLSLRKGRVFAEAARVLRPGGRLAISDIVSGRALKERTRRNVDLWAACIAGAIPAGNYVEAIAAEGLHVRHMRPNDYRFVSERALEACSTYAVQSMSLVAVKPR
jgi:2-polyprenyl-3-methyl-5-hydroxy-6-metoxy-1,4-benzoquinol methylase